MQESNSEESRQWEELQEKQDFFALWAHQIKTPIFALRLLLREEPEENRESGAQLFRIEQYVEMVLGYLRTEDMSADLKLTRCSLDRIIREQIHKYAGIFVSKKLSLSYEGTDAIVLTDEKWLGFVIGQILSNALKYTRTGGIEIWLEDERGNRVSENPNLKQNTAPGICNTAPGNSGHRRLRHRNPAGGSSAHLRKRLHRRQWTGGQPCYRDRSVFKPEDPEKTGSRDHCGFPGG